MSLISCSSLERVDLVFGCGIMACSWRVGGGRWVGEKDLEFKASETANLTMITMTLLLCKCSYCCSYV